MTRFLVKRPLLAVLAGLLVLGAGRLAAHEDHDGDADEGASRNMKLVGFNDLQARSAYQPVVHQQGGRYIAYTGHHALGTNPQTGAPLPSFNPLTGKDEENGTSIIDVTDPRRPKYLFHLPVPDGNGGGAQMNRVCDGKTLPVHDNFVYLLRTFANSAQEIWDVTDPGNPQDVRTVRNGNPILGASTGQPGAMAGTHKNWWECDTGIAYLVGRRGTDGKDGWKSGNHILIYDLGNPAKPKFIRDWALDGQQPGGKIPPHFTAVPAIHGPISTGPAGNRVYFAYGVGSNGVMQIVDRSKLLDPSITDFTSAELGRLVMNPDNGGHTSWPLGKMTVADLTVDTGNTTGNVRDIVVVVSEAGGAFCDEPRHLTFMVDVTAEGRPQSISTFQVPASSGRFCDRGGRFGPHATNEEFGPPFYQKLVFVSYFNAGVRAIDVRDPYNPKQAGFFIPAVTANTDLRCGTLNGVKNVCRAVVQTNNVATDDRGFVYIVDRANTGMHILRLTGDAARIAGLNGDDH
ncbi:MAG: hypothetical protein E6J78_09605 [Deltaproteobacteria bacterium]|nr:MAG: hypothetical protein E6J78_09605 [Deltaproteobacteria bacterium]